jgi:hypothetical protein
MSKIQPFVRAEQLTSASLYWAPAPTFPLPARYHAWYGTFCERLFNALAEQKLQIEVLLHHLYAVDGPLARTFQTTTMKYCPIQGLGRRVGVMPQTATKADIDAVRYGLKPFRFEDYTPDLLIWFTDRSRKEIWASFFGYGGTFAIAVAQDAATVPPAIPKLRVIEEEELLKDLDQRMAQAYAMFHPFLKKSIEVFGSDLKGSDDYRFEHIPFMLPILSSRDFFSAPGEQVGKWFEVFKVYFAESKEDRGMLLATTLDLEPAMEKILAGLAQEGLVFPQGEV